MKDGSSPSLALELPPDPPHPLPPIVTTRWQVLHSTTIWFRNVTELAMDVELLLTSPRHGLNRALVGELTLSPGKTGGMDLEPDLVRERYHYETWEVRLRHPSAGGLYDVGFY